MSHDSRTHGDAGFTIAEYVIAIAILFIVLMAVMGGLAFASTSTASAAKRETALNVANQRMEQARNLPYDDIGVRYSDGSYGNPPGEIVSPEQVGEFVVTTKVTWARDKVTNRSTCKTIYVTVEWEKPRKGSLTIESSITGKSTITNAGDVLIKLFDIDTTKAIAGVNVEIKPSTGVSRRLSTNSDGEVFFGYVPQGALQISASKAGYVFDLSGLAGATVSADSLASYAAPGMLASTGDVKVTDTAGVVIQNASVQISGPSGTFTANTNAQGYTQFPNLYRGDYSVSVKASGCADGTGTFRIAKGGTLVATTVTLTRVGQVNIHVADDHGVNLQGVSVTMTGPATVAPGTTSSSGDASFNIPVAGTYTVTVTKNGYVTPATKQFTVAAGQTASLTFSMAAQPNGSIRVYLVDRQNKIVKNAEVNLYNASRSIDKKGFTGNDGSYLFTDLPEATYYAKAVYRSQATITTSATNGIETPVTVVTKIN